MKLDEAQLAEQNALRKQLHQEQELLQRFQESQEEKLKAQHGREKAALDTKIESSRKELDKTVSFRPYSCTAGHCGVCLFVQLFDESVVLQNARLGRQQTLQKSHQKELQDFAREFSLDPSTMSVASKHRQGAERSSVTSEQSSTSVSMGTASL